MENFRKLIQSKLNDLESQRIVIRKEVEGNAEIVEKQVKKPLFKKEEKK